MSDEESARLSEDPEELDEIVEKIFNNMEKPEAYFIIYNDDNDTILENFGKGFLIINMGKYGLREYDKVRIEVKPGEGSALTIDRTIPGGLPKNNYVDLG